MTARQWVHVEPAGEETTCPSRGPDGWVCCLLRDHGGNHIGFTQGFGKVSQWEREDADHS